MRLIVAIVMRYFDVISPALGHLPLRVMDRDEGGRMCARRLAGAYIPSFTVTNRFLGGST